MGFITVIRPRADFTTEPLSRPAFINRFGDIGLPQSATNILYASSRVSMGFAGARLYRFDGPVADCVAYGEKLIRENNQQVERPDDFAPTALAPLTAPPERVQKEILGAYGLKKVDWFDVHTVRSGYEGRGPPYALAHFWVDTDRGRFYYYWTD